MVCNEVAILQQFSIFPMTEFAISQNQVMGILRSDICWGVTEYIVPVGTVAAKFRIPKSADRTYFGL